MRFGGVEIPAELVDAHREGRLVLFVGAGASMDPPANLPNFRHLTESIAKKAQYPVTKRSLDHPDYVLGRIEDGHVDVHRLVANLIADPDSKHNHLHEALVDLALAGPDLRIVTTNFDRHLSSAVEARKLDVEEYTAPALPVGNRFAGLVYLHGTLGQPPDRLVLTDRDFGQAYLRDAWAARFLERMFAEFTILFVGYSHGDVVMRYLARALGPDGNRYVLTHEPGISDWLDLGLRPIGYDVVDNDHAALSRAIARWAEDAGMQLLDHRRRVAELVEAPPTGIPEDDSYLEALVADPARVGLFTEFAVTVEWLDWVASQPVFRELITPGSPSSGTSEALARWFVRSFAMDERHSDHALRLIANSGGYLGKEICQEIGLRLHQRGEARPSWLGPWLVLLLRDAPDSASDWLDYALRASEWPGDREQILLLFDHLTAPRPHLSPRIAQAGTRVEVHLRGNNYWLHESWSELLKPNLGELALPLLAIADRHFRSAQHLLDAGRAGKSTWDPLSFRRSAIEPHAEDRYTEPIDVLIDAARDALEFLLDASDPIAIGYLQSWAGSASQILQRLAIHGWSHREDVDSSTKLTWVVERGWLFDYWVRHETFLLIAAAIPTASDSAIEELIDAAFEVEEPEPEHRPYERFNALAWMNSARPGHPAIEGALAQAHAVEPAWQPRSHPDLTRSTEVGFVPSRPPMSVDDFHERVVAGPTELLTELQANKGVGRWDGGSTWEDSLKLIIDGVQTFPLDGQRVLDLQLEDDEITKAVIEGWSRAELDDATATSVVRCLGTLDLEPLVRVLAEMLSDGAEVGGHPTDWTTVPGARDLARRLWELTTEDAIDSGLDEIEWLARATSHPAGNLAEFWLHTIQHDWRADEESWSGLAPEHQQALERMLAGPPTDLRTQMVEVVCARRMHFLFAADAPWTVRNLFPILDWNDPGRARRAWSTHTRWGRWNDPMLDAGLMDGYIETWSHLEDFDGEQRGPILGDLAGICLTSQRDPLEWLPGVLVKLRDDERVTFADSIADILDDLPSEAVEHQWSRWMSRYWTDRLDSIPTLLSLDECSAMAGWIPFLSASFEAGADLVIRQPGRFREHDDVLRHLDRHVDGSPNASARVIGHLMCGTAPRWWGDYHLRALWPRLRSGADQDHLDVIIEQALRLGLGNPDDW